MKKWFIDGLFLFVLLLPFFTVTTFRLPDSLSFVLAIMSTITIPIYWLFWGWLIATPFIVVYEVYKFYETHKTEVA